MNTTPTPIAPQSYAELIDSLSSQVFLAFIEQGRQSLPTSADTILDSGYNFLQRVFPSPRPKDAATIGTLHRDIQVALLDGLIRLGMPGVRQAVLDSYERMAQAADKSSIASEPADAADTPSISRAQLPIEVVIAVEPASVLEAEPSPLAAIPIAKDAPTTREGVFEQVRKTVAEHMNKDVNAITMDTTFVGDLGADSLDLVELVMLLEDRLTIEMKDEDAQKLADIRHAVDLVCVRLGIALEDAPAVAPEQETTAQ